MQDFILLMHADASEPVQSASWAAYFEALRASGGFQGGSAIGPGETFRKGATAGPASDHLTGYIRVSARTLDDARKFVAGNPVFECGGTVELRALPRQ